ncbi:MAG TPA: hypothetical protein VLG38_08275, partial [Gammaproteobacteria bacterium]|nr:hypothetical protein [Gammaproteobacteria bacterium]
YSHTEQAQIVTDFAHIKEKLFTSSIATNASPNYTASAGAVGMYLEKVLQTAFKFNPDAGTTPANAVYISQADIIIPNMTFYADLVTANGVEQAQIEVAKAALFIEQMLLSLAAFHKHNIIHATPSTAVGINKMFNVLIGRGYDLKLLFVATDVATRAQIAFEMAEANKYGNELKNAQQLAQVFDRMIDTYCQLARCDMFWLRMTDDTCDFERFAFYNGASTNEVTLVQTNSNAFNAFKRHVQQACSNTALLPWIQRWGFNEPKIRSTSTSPVLSPVKLANSPRPNAILTAFALEQAATTAKNTRTASTQFFTSDDEYEFVDEKKQALHSPLVDDTFTTPPTASTTATSFTVQSSDQLSLDEERMQLKMI